MRLRTQFHVTTAPLVAAIGLGVAGCDDDPISDPHNDPAPIVEDVEEANENSSSSSYTPPQEPETPAAPTERQASSSPARGRPPKAPSDLTVTVTQGDQ